MSKTSCEQKMLLIGGALKCDTARIAKPVCDGSEMALPDVQKAALQTLGRCNAAF
jgi:hypothetical protein